jgi:UDP-glucuronate decarboxylase
MIIVTGGVGFLGSHLIDKLLLREEMIICLDNLYTSSLSNLEQIKNNKYYRFINHDVTDPLDDSLFEDIRYIFNLACPASPVHYQYDPVKTVRTNVLGTFHCLQLAEKHDAQLFQASTSEVYGDPLEHPQKETYWGNVNPIGIRSCYDEGKRLAECLLFDYHRQKKIKIKVARIFNTYGPRMAINDGRVVSNFIIQALTGQNITIYGNGHQTRSFCYVDDLIDGILSLSFSTDTSFTGPVNLGNPVEFRLIDLAEMILRLTKSSSKIVFEKLPADDPRQRQPNIDLAKSALGWEPQIQLEEGLEKTIAYFRKMI